MGYVLYHLQGPGPPGYSLSYTPVQLVRYIHQHSQPSDQAEHGSFDEVSTIFFGQELVNQMDSERSKRSGFFHTRQTIWMFPEMGIPPVIIHFNGMFHIQKRHFGGTPMTMETPIWMVFLLSVDEHDDLQSAGNDWDGRAGGPACAAVVAMSSG